MDSPIKDINVESLIESCKPLKKRGRPSHKRQLNEIKRERRVNLQTQDSVIVATNLKSILTAEALDLLPTYPRTQLIRLLPKVDQVSKSDSQSLDVGESALSNEYFVRFCLQYQEKLSENKLSDDALEQAKTETSRELAKIDPWKLRNFEPVWGNKLISQSLDQEEEDNMIDQLIKRVSLQKSRHFDLVAKPKSHFNKRRRKRININT